MAREFYDEMYDGSGNCRSHYREFARWLAANPPSNWHVGARRLICCSTAPASPSPCMATSRAPSA